MEGAFPTPSMNSSNSRGLVAIQQEQLPALHTANTSLPSIPIYAEYCIASFLDWNILNPRLTTPKCLVWPSRSCQKAKPMIGTKLLWTWEQPSVQAIILNV